jgi:hypothetical protein
MAGPRRREAVASALYALVDASAKHVVSLKTSSRRLRHYTNVDPHQMPALFQTQKPETQERKEAMGLPAKRTMHFEFYLYTADPQEDSVVPIQQLNNMVDAIEAALAPNQLTGKQTLGDLVTDARIDGSVEFFENVTTDGKSIAIVPVAVIMP